MKRDIKNIDRSLQDLLNDNRSGSTELLENLNRILIQCKNDSVNLKKVIRDSRDNFFSFRIIIKYLDDVEKYIRKEDYSGLSVFLNKFKNQSDDLIESIYKNARKFLIKCNKIVTLSNSKTIERILKLLAKEKQITVIVCESRPMFEGRVLASNLIKAGINVELITDANGAAAIKNSDGVLIGADIVLSNGDVVNKTGSVAAAVLCRYYKKPFYAAAQRSKFSKKKQYKPVEHNKSEIWKNPPASLKIRNNYFEVIDSNLITKIFTD